MMVNLNVHARQFLDLVADNFELIAVPPEIVSFCQAKLNLTDRAQIEALVVAINKWLKSPAPETSTSHQQQIASILANPHQCQLRDAINQAIDQEGGRIKAKLVSCSGHFTDTLRGSQCERVSSKEFVLDLEVQIDPRHEEETASPVATRSFVLSEEQLSGLLEDMARIREQLLRSLPT